MAVEYRLTPGDAWPVAEAASAWLASQGYRVHVEREVDREARFVPALTGTRNGAPTVYVEALNLFVYSDPIVRFGLWVGARDMNAEFVLAIPVEQDVPLRSVRRMRSDGIGLLLVEDNVVVDEPLVRPRNPALQVHLQAGIPLGNRRAAVQKCFDKFNSGDRKSGFRDLCELVEACTMKLVERALQRGLLKSSKEAATRMDWSNRINVLASVKQYHDPARRLVSEALKQDLHSFRQGRNLYDHPVANRRAELKRDLQGQERMLAGARLLGELGPIHRRT